MRIAVVGSGIAGLASAWLLSRQHEVTLFEAAGYFGGHTHTHEVEQQGRRYRIDSGFIVHNPSHYPLLTQMFEQLGVDSQPTTMSFSLHNEASGLEYNATTLDTLFCQRRNLLSPRFIGMVRDLARFYREAPALLHATGPGPTLGDYLAAHGYGAAFRDEHLVPMASALWSSPASRILGFPARYLVQFMANHQMLQVSGRPQWRVVKGGSSTYVHALRARWPVRERLACPVRSVHRHAAGVEVRSAAGAEHFDHLVLACHSDQALALLADADEREHAILGAMPYQTNDTVLHTDARVLPVRRRAWAAWNAWLPRDPDAACTVSYCMNLLQGIESPEPFVVTLNRSDAIDPEKVLARMQYHHPVYSHASVAAQSRKAEIQGRRHTWFAGAYWGWGFHEDGMRSAAEIAAAFGVRWLEGRSPAPEAPRAEELAA
ncbi:FAD-dependent oxidoreductase [Rhodanobacter denitrificans]|uniref:FAD-dependent oxidoreductase n=1 Tax=Rhodanobacter denitrificans TaxID=666685 RepID=A0A368KEX3_9GAMM|nr:FAD-dependent oxidoreductase [Rhodanobacter denitrificans]RCS30460.1 FAD-dependent oxidoreductase [Rhodanobacter denitrificans]